jgi:hypothetical protein
MPKDPEKNACTVSVQDADSGSTAEADKAKEELVYARLRLIAMQARGVALRIEGGQILVTGAELLTVDDRKALKERRQHFVQIFELGECSGCHKLLDVDGCCWKCRNRRCGCGGWTGSPFIRMCVSCAVLDEAKEKGATSEPAR